MILFLFGCSATAFASEKTVLFVHSNRSNGPGTMAYDRTFQAELTAALGDQVNLYNEYTDLWRLQGDAYFVALHEFLRQKYADQKFDLIIADGPSVIRFLTKFGDELFPKTPVVFCITDKMLIQGLTLPQNMTGIFAGIEFGKTIEAALKLQPNTKLVVVIAGGSDLDKEYLASARQDFSRFEPAVTFEYLTDLPLEEMENRVSHLRTDAIVYCLPFYQDGAGRFYIPFDVGRRIARAASVPLYGSLEGYLYGGGLGGYAWSLEAEAKEVSRLALRILAGERPQDIPPHVGATNRYIFDWHQLRRWRIPEERLPEGSILRNKELTLWERYRWYIVSVATLTLVETLLIIYLLLNRELRRRVEKERERLASLVQTQHRHLDEVVSNVPGIVWESRLAPDGTRKEQFVSQHVEKMLGYTVDEWMSVPRFWLSIIPEAERDEALKKNDEVFQSGRDGVIRFRWKTKDGRLLWVEAHLSVIFDDQNQPVGLRGVTLDVTDRKAAEDALRESEDRNRAILRAIPDLMFLQTTEGVYLDFHAADPKALLVPPSAFLGKNMRDILPPALVEDFAKCFRSAEEQEEPQSLEYMLPLNGHERWFEARIVHTEGDKILSVVRDVTERKEAEESLRESEGRFRTMANTAPMMVWMSGVDKLCNFFNRSWLEFTGRTLEQELGDGWAEGVHPDDLQHCLETYSRAFDNRTKFVMEYRLRRFDGEYRWVLDEGLPRYTPDGNFAGYIGSCMDFTERRNAEEALRSALAQVEQLKDQLQQENVYLREQVQLEHQFQEIVGDSDEIKYVLFKIQQVAPTDTTVLILGETGTGKELVARAIHGASGRKARPMVKINCATLPSSLIESELFGHEKGAFTGAQTRKIGRFEVADGATLFLDEIGELPLELQSKLLRVLQEGEFERLGSSQTRKIDVRIIAATNRNLKVEVQNGLFREDLWYRLNVFPITVPPLRQRKHDIPSLVSFFVSQFNRKLGRVVKTISPQTLHLLQNYSWPGNVRELANVVERALINSNGSVLQLADKLEVEKSSDEAIYLDKRPGTLEDVERDHITATLDLCDWRIEGPSGAAAILGINSSTLRSRMQKLGIKRPKPSPLAASANYPQVTP